MPTRSRRAPRRYRLRPAALRHGPWPRTTQGKDVIEASQLHRALVDGQAALGVGLAVIDRLTGRHVVVSDALAAIYGCTPEEVMALPSYLDPLAEEDRAAAGERLQDAPSPPRRSELTVVRPDGSRVRAEASLEALEDDRAVLLVRMLTDHDRASRDLRDAERRFATLVERVPAVVYEAETGEEGRWHYISPYVETMLGFPPDEWVADPGLWARRLHSDDRERVLEHERRLGGGERLSVEYRMLARDGSVVWVHDDACPREDGGGAMVLDGLLIETSDRKAAEARLQHLADHDALTGLLNHRRFVEELELEIAVVRRGMRSSSAIVIDVDGFKQVNDSLGHQAGDELLRAIAAVLSERLRASDAVARLGGDEFGLLLRGTPSDAAAALAAELLATLREHSFALVGGDTAHVTASAGVAGLEDGVDASAEAVLSAADLAMYEGKHAGRDRVERFTPDLQAELERGRTWVSRLGDALANDGFTLFAQPVLDLHTGEIAQHELLLRLPGDDGELAGPEAFLPIAERFDLVEAIDHWVLMRALALLRDPGSGDLVFEVNVAGRSIGGGQVIPLLEREIGAGGLDPSRLIVEVTEMAAIANMQATREFSDALGRLGVRIALDDFGSGFGSFYYLRNLPVDYLKIDGEFIAGLSSSPVDQEVVKAIVMLARAVGRRTIAEFVPDQSTQDLLAGYGVDLAQGFHVGRPHPVEDLW